MTTYSDSYPTAASVEAENAAWLKEHAAFRQALHAKEEAERQAEQSRQDYVQARATGTLYAYASAAMAYAEAANMAVLAAEHYEGLVVDEASRS